MLGARQEQVQDKMEAVRHAQQESLERREELVRELEVAQQLTRRDVERDEAQKTERKAELESQVITQGGGLGVHKPPSLSV